MKQRNLTRTYQQQLCTDTGCLPREPARSDEWKTRMVRKSKGNPCLQLDMIIYTRMSVSVCVCLPSPSTQVRFDTRLILKRDFIIIIIIIILKLHCWHEFFWLSLVIHPNHTSLPAGRPDSILCTHRAVIGKFLLVGQHRYIYVKVSIEERRLWVRPFFSWSGPHILFDLFG